MKGSIFGLKFQKQHNYYALQYLIVIAHRCNCWVRHFCSWFILSFLYWPSMVSNCEMWLVSLNQEMFPLQTRETATSVPQAKYSSVHHVHLPLFSPWKQPLQEIKFYLENVKEKHADHSGRAATVGSNPCWGIAVSVRLFCVCAVLCAGSGLATGWSPVQESYRLCKKSRNWNSGQGPTKDCRTIDRQIDRQTDREMGVAWINLPQSIGPAYPLVNMVMNVRVQRKGGKFLE
jgi:hypothetical protein